MPVEQQELSEMGAEPSPQSRPARGGWGERIAWALGSAVFVTFCSLICTAITLLFLWNMAKTQDLGMSALLVPLQGVVTIPVGYFVSVAYVITKASNRDAIVHNKRARSAVVGAALPVVVVVIAGAVYSISESNRPTVQSYIGQSEQAVDLLRDGLPVTGGSSSVNWQGTEIGLCQLEYSEAIGTFDVQTADMRPHLLRAEELLVADGFRTSRLRTTAEPITSTLVAYRDDRLIEVSVVLDEEVDGYGDMEFASFAGPCVQWRGEEYLQNPPSRRGVTVSGWQLESMIEENSPTPEAPSSGIEAPVADPEPSVDPTEELFALTDPNNWWLHSEDTVARASRPFLCGNLAISQSESVPDGSTDPEGVVAWYLDQQEVLVENGFAVRTDRIVYENADGPDRERWSIWAVREDHAVEIGVLFWGNLNDNGYQLSVSRTVYVGECVTDGGLDLASKLPNYDVSRLRPPISEVPDLED